MDSLDSKLEMVIDFILQMKMDMFMLAAQSVVSDNDFNKLQTHNYYSSTSISALPNHIYCQFLNIVLPTQQVTCTHIFQKHWFKERRLLNLSEINEPRNLMLLFRPIEIAFDESRIIFLWDSTSKSFKRKILDPGLRFDSKTMLPPTILDLAMRAFPKDYTPSTPVNSKFKKSLVDLEGDSLKFASSIPFKRCLAFHATRARYEAIHVHKWLQKEDFDIPEDAWSPNISESPELKSFIELWRNAE
ncbi:hypothetical protein BDR26DRAFT_890992 [Obelidium mucronatum]|nr:hypothetical protein BDR26DRAFT_890992 [Obelidium mucronatum]